MNPVQQNPTEAAHRDLQNVLLSGRILINGLPLTGNELGAIIQEEQMLYGKATQLDKAQALAASQKAGKKPVKGKPYSNVVPFKKPGDKPNEKKE